MDEGNERKIHRTDFREKSTTTDWLLFHQHKTTTMASIYYDKSSLFVVDLGFISNIMIMVI